MGNAFIESDASHRQTKKFKQRLKYRLDLGCSYDEAHRLACIKEIAGHTSLRLLPGIFDSIQQISPKAKNELLPHLGDISSKENRLLKEQDDIGRISSDLQIPLPTCDSHIPSRDEIRLEVEKLKLAGFMTEVPMRTNFVSSAEKAPLLPPLISSDRIKPDPPSTSISGISRLPYWTVSTLACCWLVYSMTTSLPGHWFWNLLIAVSFEFTPMLMLGARVDRKYQRTVSWGALGIFMVGLGLYLAPSIQTLVNESSSYVESSNRYVADLRDYQARSANSAELVKAAKADTDRSQKSYENALNTYGETSWRTVAAKKQKISDAAEWKRQSVDAEIAKVPIAPKISDELTKAAQAIATRIGLFAVVFLSMFVMRRLEGPETD